MAVPPAAVRRRGGSARPSARAARADRLRRARRPALRCGCRMVVVGPGGRADRADRCGDDARRPAHLGLDGVRHESGAGGSRPRSSAASQPTGPRRSPSASRCRALPSSGSSGRRAPFPGSGLWSQQPAQRCWCSRWASCAPLIVEPLFNRFRPLDDARLAAELRALADRAQTPDQGRAGRGCEPTPRKANAYVSGLGRTRRLVLYDTLLAGATRAEVGLVLAHELDIAGLTISSRRRCSGDRRRRLRLPALGAAVWPSSADAIGAPGGAAGNRASSVRAPARRGAARSRGAVGAALSRRWEREADRFSLELTGDLGAFERDASLTRDSQSRGPRPAAPDLPRVLHPPHARRADRGGAPAGAGDRRPMRRT